MDEQRLSDLQMIQAEVVSYWSLKNSLPQDLGVLKNNISGFVAPTDPETMVSYEYLVKGDLDFELCAIFATSDKDYHSNSQNTPYYSPYGSFQQNWEHTAGRVCFSRNINPELYKADEKNAINPMLLK